MITHGFSRAPLSRRRFLAGCSLTLAACASGNAAPAPPAGDRAPEARFYDRLKNGTVRCRLCPRDCIIPPGRAGFCRVRENQNGTLRSRVYGRPVVRHADPVEKKPFFHVWPGTQTFSLATVGCNMACAFCQNYDIATATPDEIHAPFLPPATLASQARAAGCRSIAFTYSEPIVFYEYTADCARAARDLGLGRLMISNGFIQAEPLRDLLPLLTAVKIDLKSFEEEFYRRVCNGRLQPVLDTLTRIRDAGVWLEVVTLLIPGLNDSTETLKRLAGWLAGRLSPDVPFHLSRFHPAYKMRHLPPTPYASLLRARELARQEGCRFVYLGNAPGLGGEATLCPGCGAPVVTRHGYRVDAIRLQNGACPECGKPVPGLWR